MRLLHFFPRAFPSLANPPLFSDPRSDFHGAVVGTLASIPQTMAYGLMVGAALGPEWSGIGVMAALAGATFAAAVSAVCGGCPVMIPGPRAATLLVLVGLYDHLRALPDLHAVTGADGTVFLLGGVAVALAGLLQVAFGLLRVGRLTSYIPVPVVAGFVNGSAILILISQVWAALGLPPHRSLWELWRHVGDIQPLTLLLSLGTAGLILNLGRWCRTVPPPLAGLALGTLAYLLGGLAGWGDALGGTMPPLPAHLTLGFIGVPAFAILTAPLGSQLIGPVLTAAAAIAVLSSLDSLLSVAASDAATLRRSDGSRQLLAEGVANVVSGLFGMLPGSGSMARTSAALRGGLISALGVIFVALMTGAVTLLLAPLIRFLPSAAMAGLLIAVALGLFDPWSRSMVTQLLRNPRQRLAAHGDLLSVSLVVLTTVAVNLGTALVVGLLISLVAFAVQMAHSPIRRSYRATVLAPRIHGDDNRLRFLQRHGSRIAVIELEGALFYGTVAPLEAAVDRLVADGVVHIVCDFRRIKDIDVSGARILERLQTKLSHQGGMLAISYVDRERRGRDQGDSGGNRRRGPRQSRPIWRKLEFLGSIEALGEDRLVTDTNQALRLCERHLAAQVEDEETTPEVTWINAAILRGINRTGIRRLRQYVTLRDYAAGERIFDQGAPPDSVYFIVSGVVDIFINLSGTDRKLRLQTLSPGAVFGEMAIIAPSPRSANVAAVEPTRCWQLPAEMFDRIKTEEPGLAFALLSNMADIFAQRLRATNQILADLEA